MESTILWTLFGLVVALLLALDLGVFHRRAHVVQVREALTWSVVWVALALAFGAGVFYWRGPDRGVEYLTGYVIEWSLSVDNVFLFTLIFAYFRIPPLYQHRVLFWGILSAIVMRGLMIAGGAALISRFHWVLYLFGIFLVLTGVKMYLQRNKEADPGASPLLRWMRRRLPLTDTLDGPHFFTRIQGVRHATPLFLTLALVEFTDLVFAVDSIPAIFAVTRDPFIVFTSNVFAILGLRSLFFLLSGVMGKFRYLKVGLSAILIFVGIKMLLPVKPAPLLSLGIVLAILAASILFSLARQEPEPLSNRPAEDAGPL